MTIARVSKYLHYGTCKYLATCGSRRQDTLFKLAASSVNRVEGVWAARVQKVQRVLGRNGAEIALERPCRITLNCRFDHLAACVILPCSRVQ
jgi:hypothetical protein